IGPPPPRRLGAGRALEARGAGPGPPLVARVGEHAVDPDDPPVGRVGGRPRVVPPAVAARAVHALRIPRPRLEQGAGLQLAERVGGPVSDQRVSWFSVAAPVKYESTRYWTCGAPKV